MSTVAKDREIARAFFCKIRDALWVSDHSCSDELESKKKEECIDTLLEYGYQRERDERVKVKELLEALKDVVRIADRKTDIFDHAHAVIAKHGPPMRTDYNEK